MASITTGRDEKSLYFLHEHFTLLETAVRDILPESDKSNTRIWSEEAFQRLSASLKYALWAIVDKEQEKFSPEAFNIYNHMIPQFIYNQAGMKEGVKDDTRAAFFVKLKLGLNNFFWSSFMHGSLFTDNWDNEDRDFSSIATNVKTIKGKTQRDLSWLKARLGQYGRGECSFIVLLEHLFGYYGADRIYKDFPVEKDTLEMEMYFYYRALLMDDDDDDEGPPEDVLINQDSLETNAVVTSKDPLYPSEGVVDLSGSVTPPLKKQKKDKPLKAEVKYRLKKIFRK